MFKTMTGSLDPRKNPSLEEIQKIPSFIFCQWLSGNPITVKSANLINYYYDIPIENQYYMIKNAFAGKIKYIPYIKNEKIDNQKMQEWVSDYYKISLDKSSEYLSFMNESEKKYISDLYTEKELKK